MKPLLAENSEKLGSNSSYIIKNCAEAIQCSLASVFSSVEGLYGRLYRFTARSKQVNRWSPPVRHWGNKRVTGQSEAWADTGLSHLWERNIFHKEVLPNFTRSPYQWAVSRGSMIRDPQWSPRCAMGIPQRSPDSAVNTIIHYLPHPQSALKVSYCMLYDLTLKNALFSVLLSGTLVWPLKIHQRGHFPAWGAVCPSTTLIGKRQKVWVVLRKRSCHLWSSGSDVHCTSCYKKLAGQN